MKIIKIHFAFLFLIASTLFSQQKINSTIHKVDSLDGFEAKYFLAIDLPAEKQDNEYKAMLAKTKRNYINKKYNLISSINKTSNSNSNTVSPAKSFNLLSVSNNNTSYNNNTTIKNGNPNNTVNSAPEICDNGIDDDSDGLIDINDSDCNCGGFSSTVVVPSLIPNADFEQTNCCPSSFSQVNCAASWVQATTATSDYFNCGFAFGAATAAGIDPPPAANGNGYIGAIFSPGWQEYVGACLSSPMVSGVPYQLSMSIASSWIDGWGGFCQAGAPPPINITIFGHPNCGNLPAGGTGCPGGGWVAIGSALYNPNNTWAPITITFTPTFNVGAIMIGSPCTLPAGYNSGCYPYFYFDNIILNATTLFNTTTIAQTGGICTNDLVLTATATSTLSGGTWQWYKSGIAVVGQTTNTLNVSLLSLGTGTFNVRYTIGTTCEVVNHVVLPAVYPVANFSVNSACLGSSFSFTNTSSTATGTNTFSWDLGNATPTINTTSPTYTYPLAGNYTVTLIATNTEGCKDSIKKNVSVYALPLANFSTSYISCGSTSFIATSTSSLNGGSTITNYVYHWNDGSNNSPINPAPHSYLTSGPQQIKLVITNANGCKDSINHVITVAQKPTASFSVNPICVGAVSDFTNTSTTPSGTNSYTWNYGNGSAINTLVNPSYTYPMSGIYSVTLDVVNSDGCADSQIMPLSIYGRASVNFSSTPVCFNTAITFNNLTSTTVNANTSAVSSWSWNFGSTPASSSNSQHPVFTYTNPINASTNTTYSITLFATTANGCKDSLTLPLTVYSLPVADFTSNSVCLTNQTTLSDASNSNGNPFFLFAWDFNQDGIADATNNALTTTTVFPNFGSTPVTYTVYTNATGSLMCPAVITKTVWVNPLPSAAITNTNTCIDTQPSLISGISSSIAVGTVTNYAWDYGNGNTSLANTTASSSYSYSSPGNYLVTLTLTSNAGCSGIVSKTVEVWEKPYASFNYSKACFGKKTVLNAIQSAISGSITSYNWDFNNLLASVEATGKTVEYIFPSEGSQSVNMLLTTDKGCKNTLSGNIYINYNPRPNFYVPKRSGCADLCVNIIDSSLVVPGPAKNSNWFWDFGNGNVFSSSNGNLNTICYGNESNTQTKNYTLKLILRTDSGCVDSITRNNYLTVYPNPQAGFDWQGESGDILAPKVHFTNTSVGYSNFAWYFNDGKNITDSTKNNPTHDFDTDLPGSFNVFLAVRNQYGCKDTINKLVDISPEFTFYIPNAFTPNEDGVNDMFIGKGIGIKTYNMWIFDRWGEKLFYTNDIKNGWDGSIKGKQVDDKIDVYQWKVILTDLNNKQRQYNGHVTIIK